MARVFITGSADGLGLMAAESLHRDGHEVVLHARAAGRAPDFAPAVIGDVTTIAGMRAVAEQATALGPYDAVIHNVAVGYREPRSETPDGLEHVFAVNVLAPYALTVLMPLPQRLVYLSSGMHHGGTPGLADPQWTVRRWNGSQAYSDSKFLDVLLALGFARRHPRVLSNAVDPGWVATRMGGPGAPDDLTQGAVTQTWLAVSDDPRAKVTGRYFHHQRQYSPFDAANDVKLQDELLDYCASLL
ncbi:SDR family NAD(P)-dependent oxidoreductase [Winogradskya consettensis]|uniref:Short-chain dehydrogenase n=1 Tax=Winogradskya consettensis TaxID=113560 RepID=A0A919VSG2_9ACTN|nr:SDR family NAD(P)-dependent oxidoreductase [Actinoplanes consettensis]GIM73810.1 short-chain dehydrogenase [Actinoplanes consettensis]